MYANYFRVNVAPKLDITRYNVEVMPEAKGKKLNRIFQLLLEKPEFSQCVSDGKSIVVSLQPLNIQQEQTFAITYLAEGQDEPLNNAVTYTVRVVTPTSLDVAGFVNYLGATNTGPKFPQQSETIQALNILFGHHPQANDGVVSIGQNRHFLTDRSQQNVRNVQILGGGLESLRGYFQSVRPATGGLLLNVNVTHGVFLEPIRLDQIMPRLGTGNRITLQKKLKLVRVNVTHLPVKKNKANQNIPRVKTIFGLAHLQDGRGDAHPPQVKEFGAGPKDVKFWIAALPAPAGKKAGKAPQKSDGLPTNAYITVFDYFRKSRNSYL